MRSPRPGARVGLLHKGQAIWATYRGSDRGLWIFRLASGRTLRLRAPNITQRENPSRWDNAPAPRVPIRREAKAHASTRRSRWAETRPGERAGVKAGNAKPVRACECQLCGGSK